MRRIFFLLILFVYSNIDAQYCTTTGIPTTDSEDEIFNVSITTTTLNNSSDCSTTLPAPSVKNRFSDYTTVLPPTLLPIGTHTFSITRGSDCIFAHASSAGAVVFIDYNQDGDWVDAGERVLVFANGINQSQTVTGTFTVPNNATVGLTRMRVMLGENMNGNTQMPCNPYTWGETEDYPVFIGQRKWDYEMVSMTAPDSIRFCGQDPVEIKAVVKNVENQPMPGGRVDLFIRGVEAGSTTNMYVNKSFTQTVLTDQTLEVTFNPILFPKDELLEFKYVIYHPLDSYPQNDTLIKYVQVYKNPVYKLKGNEVCADSQGTAIIYDMPKQLYFKWANEAIVDTTKFQFPITSYAHIDITRGWKCNVKDSVKITVNPLPKLTLSRDTILCNGQSVKLKALMDINGFAYWNNNLKDTMSVNTSGSYVATAESDKMCRKTGFTNITIVNPPSQPKVTDTVCLGDIATVGLGSNVTGFIYSWRNRSETTPLINPIPTVNGEKYYVQWWYQGCTSQDSVTVSVNPLPNVQVASPTPAICPFFSSDLTVSGANSYLWKNGYGTSSTITVSPLTTTKYTVIGTDTKGCKKEVIYQQIVHPRPDMTVYSNKSNHNVCLGDSAIIYANGGKTYSWSTGATDSTVVIYPTESFQWTMIGTDGNGCKDTVSYRMFVKPAMTVNYPKNLKACEGETVTVNLSGAKEYDWGPSGGGLQYVNDSTFQSTVYNSTSYQVTATSSFDCEQVILIPVTVSKKPIPQVSDLTICQGQSGMLEAKGGVRYEWLNSNANPVMGDTSRAIFTGSVSQNVRVVVYNQESCNDTAETTVNVISTDPNNVPVVFKSPLSIYKCASVHIPISLAATPSGGVWSGTNVNGNKLTPLPGDDTIQVMYKFLEPRNGCEIQAVKKVIFTKCASGISDIDDMNEWSIYPVPFTDVIHIQLNQHTKSEDAHVMIYDIAGRQVYTSSHRLQMGDNLIKLENLELSKGTYYLDFQTETYSRQTKIVK